MEMKIVYYPRRKEYVILEKHPYAMRFGRMRDENQQVYKFNNFDDALKVAKKAYKESLLSLAARTVWTSEHGLIEGGEK